MDKAIVLSFQGDETWGQIVEQLAAEMGDGELPDNVLQAAEMLVSGMPVAQIARKLSVSPGTVRTWLTQYPTMARLVADGKKLLHAWRMAKLEEQFHSAIARSAEILSVDLDGTYTDKQGEPRVAKDKIMGQVGQQARFIISTFVGQQVNVNVNHNVNDPLLKAKADALDYLAEQLHAQRRGSEEEPIEAVIRVDDSSKDVHRPMLLSDGQAPFGTVGALDQNNDGIQCHVCGGRYKNLRRHLSTRHDLLTSDYEILYALPDGSVLAAQGGGLHVDSEEEEADDTETN